MTAAIETYVSQTLQRFGDLDPTLVFLIQESYQSGSSADIINNLNSGAYAFTVAGKSELVLYSGKDTVAGSTQILANAYIKANSRAYNLDATAAGQYVNSDSTFNATFKNIESALGRSLSDKEKYTIKEPAFRFASAKLVETSIATSLRIILGDNISPTAVFNQNELPPALGNTHFTTINGAAAAPIRAAADPFTTILGTQGNFINESFGRKNGAVVYDPPGIARGTTPSLISEQTAAFNNSDFARSSGAVADPTGKVTLPGEKPVTFLLKEALGKMITDQRGTLSIADGGLLGLPMSAVDSFMAKAMMGAGISLGALGIALTVLDIQQSHAAAQRQLDQGDYDGAASTMGALAGRIGLGVVWAEAGLIVGGSLAASLAAASLIVAGGAGAIGLGIITAAAFALAGGALGSEMGSKLALMVKQATDALIKAAGEAFPETTEKVLADYIAPFINLFNQSRVIHTGGYDPIVLDLSANHAGIQLTALAGSKASFDLLGNGFAVRTGWVGPQTGLLALDKNNNGIIDNITELFGDNTVDGFTALKAVDDNHDNKITSADTVFSNLKIWLDANGNGKTESGELKTLSEFGITAINLNAASSNQVVNGNQIALMASYITADGKSGTVAEAFFNNSNLDSYFTGNYTLNPLALLLPNLRGYGMVTDLYVAMSMDPTLLAMVQNFSALPLDNASSYRGLVENIIYQWIGVTAISSTSRGPFADAKQLAAMEKFLGEKFKIGTGNGNPSTPEQGNFLQQAWQGLFDSIFERLVAQGPLFSSFANIHFDYANDKLVGTADLPAAITAMGSHAPADPLQNAQYWAALLPFVDRFATALGISTASYDSALTIAYAASNSILPLEAVRHPRIGGSADNTIGFSDSAAHYVDASTGNDTINMSSATGSSILLGGAGNDTINTGYGARFVSGGEGNDYIRTQWGADLIAGDNGDDTVLVGGPSAKGIMDGGQGYDKLVVTPYTTLSNVTLQNFEELDIQAYGGITLAGQQLDLFPTIIGTAGATFMISSVGAGTYNFLGKKIVGNLAFYGSSGSENIQATNGNDIIYAGNGNDTINTAAGNDTINISATPGTNSIAAGAGNDTIALSKTTISAGSLDGGTGIDTLAVTYEANIANAIVTGFERLSLQHATYAASITLRPEQLAQFTTIDGDTAGQIAAIYGATQGTYDFSRATTTGIFQLFGSTGDDIIKGSAYNDRIYNNGGADIIYGNKGDDVITFSLADGVAGAVNGGDGNDVITLGGLAHISAARAGTTIFGGNGYDIVNVSDGSYIMGTHFSSVEELDLYGNSYGFAAIDVSSNQLSAFQKITAVSASSIIFSAVEAGTYDISGTAVVGSKIYGSNGNDYIAGSVANDWLMGAGGDDRIVYDIADTNVDGGVGSDTLIYKGSDALNVNLTATADQVTGGGIAKGFENIDGGTATGAMSVLGDASANTLLTGSGNDSLQGGGGNDVLKAGAGDDNAYYDAADMLIDGGTGIDTLRFSGTTTITINLATTTDQVTGGGIAIGFENIDGSFGQTAALAITGNNYSNNLTGGTGNDILNGGHGNDILTGGLGSDAYQFGRGYGLDTVVENDASTGNKDVLNFLSGITNNQLWFTQTDNSLEIAVIGTNDKVTINDWYLSSAHHVESIQAGGKEIVDTSVQKLVTAMAALVPPPFGQTSLTMQQHAALDPIIAANWHNA